MRLARVGQYRNACITSFSVIIDNKLIATIPMSRRGIIKVYIVHYKNNNEQKLPISPIKCRKPHLFHIIRTIAFKNDEIGRVFFSLHKRFQSSFAMISESNWTLRASFITNHNNQNVIYVSNREKKTNDLRSDTMNFLCCPFHSTTFTIFFSIIVWVLLVFLCAPLSSVRRFILVLSLFRSLNHGGHCLLFISLLLCRFFL